VVVKIVLRRELDVFSPISMQYKLKRQYPPEDDKPDQNNWSKSKLVRCKRVGGQRKQTNTNKYTNTKKERKKERKKD